MVETGEQDPRIAVLLASDREDVEQRRPGEVVHAHTELGEPDRDRVGRIRLGRSQLDGEPGERDRDRLVEGVGRWQEALGERCVLGDPERRTEAGAHQRIGAVGWQEQPELLHQPVLRDGPDLTRLAAAVGHHPCMRPDRQRTRSAGVDERLRAADIVEVAVDDADHRGVGVLAHLRQRPRHLLDRVAGVDRDQTLAGPRRRSGSTARCRPHTTRRRSPCGADVRSGPGARSSRIGRRRRCRRC